MGAYSSWPIMALTHHLIILYAHKLAGRRSIKYAVLGDDALIYEEITFRKYI